MKIVLCSCLMAAIIILLLIYKEVRALNALIGQKPPENGGVSGLIKPKRRAARLSDNSKKWLDMQKNKQREAV